MGMVLFNKSGTFNPLTYGLKAGDIIHVVVVGAGGGGSGESGIGGDGGPSSFGSFLTALGGSGGKWNLPSTFVGSFIGGGIQYSGSGAGGWHPAVSEWGGDGKQSDGSCEGLFQFNDLAGVPYLKKSSVSSAGPLYVNSRYSPFKVSGSTFRGCHGIFCGAGGGMISSEYSNGGGSGYGAGGGGGKELSSSENYGCGGCSGEVKFIDIVLSSTSSVAVSVGGGGGGGARSNAGNPGGAGSSGDGGVSGSTYIGGNGGYGDTLAQDGTSTSTYGAGGGGAGGCVCVFW